MPRTAYLIPGRGGKWGGRCRDVRRRRFRRRRFRRRRRRRRLRSSGWVAAGGRATHPAGLAGRLADRGTLTLSEKNLGFRKPRICEKKQ